MFEKIALLRVFQQNPLCIDHRCVNYEDAYLHKFSKKFKIVSGQCGHAYWDQEKLSDEKTGDEKFVGAVPVSTGQQQLQQPR